MTRSSINPPSAKRINLRWYHIYFLLAAFDVATVLASLYLNHYTQMIFRESLDTNVIWLRQLGDFNKLSELASQANAPGNDVFDSQNTTRESLRLAEALETFNKALTRGKRSTEELLSSGHLDYRSYKALTQRMTSIDKAMNSMTTESSLIFDFIRSNNPTAAGERMATMDRRYADLTTEIGLLLTECRSILMSKLTAQHKRSNDLRWLEFSMIGLAIIMIVAVTIYGHRLASSMKRHEQERDARVHDLEKLTAELELSLARLGAMTNKAPVGIFETDASGRCTYVNAEWSRISGLGIEEARDNGWTEAIHKDDRAIVAKEWYAAAHSGHQFALDYRFQNREGEITWVKCLASPITLGDGSVVGYIGSLTDISKSKDVEHKLAEAKRLAEETSAAKSEFLANMSHEIRTPMNGVIGMTELLLESELSAEQQDLAETVRLSASALLTVINDILDFSKIEAGKLTIFNHPFSFAQFVASIERIHSTIASGKKISFSVIAENDGDDELLTDSDRLRQVLVNLLGNAMKFTPPGGSILLNISVNSGSDRSRELSVEVIDTGIGIAEERQDEIFNPFTQEDGSTSRRFGGTGLGLTISSKLVELLGGTLKLKSRTGTGSVFYFTIKLESKPNELIIPTNAIPNRVSSQSRPLSILLAEDNQVNQKLASKILEKAGHKVTLATNGREALDLSAASEFDLILMDIQMPEMGGDAATAAIRERERQLGTASVPIVALTANAMAGDSEKYLALGMNGYVSKPLERVKLFQAIDAAVNRSTIKQT